MKRGIVVGLALLTLIGCGGKDQAVTVARSPAKPPEPKLGAVVEVPEFVMLWDGSDPLLEYRELAEANGDKPIPPDSPAAKLHDDHLIGFYGPGTRVKVLQLGPYDAKVEVVTDNDGTTVGKVGYVPGWWEKRN